MWDSKETGTRETSTSNQDNRFRFRLARPCTISADRHEWLIVVQPRSRTATSSRGRRLHERATPTCRADAAGPVLGVEVGTFEIRRCGAPTNSRRRRRSLADPRCGLAGTRGGASTTRCCCREGEEEGQQRRRRQGGQVSRHVNPQLSRGVPNGHAGRAFFLYLHLYSYLSFQTTASKRLRAHSSLVKRPATPAPDPDPEEVEQPGDEAQRSGEASEEGQSPLAC